MPNPSPVIYRDVTDHCGCFADAPPLPMGCAACGHPPYAHRCPGRPADHDYVQPDGRLMAMRLAARHRGGPHSFPVAQEPAGVAPAEVIPISRAQRRRTRVRAERARWWRRAA